MEEVCRLGLKRGRGRVSLSRAICTRSRTSSPPRVRVRSCLLCVASMYIRSIELDPLSERHLLRVIDRTSAPPAILLPGVPSGFATPARGVVAAEGSADLGARGAGVDVDDAAAGAGGAGPEVGVADVAAGARQSSGLLAVQESSTHREKSELLRA